jgi:polysaccharide biosynthesis protein PslH
MVAVAPREERRNLLYVTHRVPFPPDKGDRIRTFNTLRFLAERHDVHLACLADEEVATETRGELDRLCRRVAIHPVGSGLRWLKAGWSLVSGGTASVGAFRSASLAETLRGWVRETKFDLVLASASSVAPYLRFPELRDIPAIVDLVDVDSQKWLDYAAAASGVRKWVYGREGQALRHYEREVAAWARAILLVSEAESELFRGIAPQATIRTITNGVDLEYFRPDGTAAQRALCVFVGAMDYRPNVDAVCWFAEAIWPGVRRAVPEATFRIVGRKPAPAVEALQQHPGIEVIGQVPDVRPYVNGAAVVVAPLRIARGLQNKVLEALALAKPVVAGPPALAGFPPGHTPPALCASSPEEWISSLVGLFGDAERQGQLARAGREYVERHFHWDRCLEPLDGLIQQLTRAGSAGLPC